MDISKIVLDVRETIGEKTLLLEWRPSFSYAGGVKGEQDGRAYPKKQGMKK